MSQNLSGSYAIADHINAAGFPFVPVGDLAHPFNGAFVGLGSDASIDNLTINSNATYVGLFGVAKFPNDLSAQYIRLNNASITGTSTSAVIGAIAGWNQGSIRDSSVTGSVVASGANAAAGGIAGESTGYIADTYSRASVHSTLGIAGGLIGTGGNISDAYATGQVSGATKGGLVGSGGASVFNAYYDYQSTGVLFSAGGQAVTTAALKSGIPAGWSDWGISPSINDGYPYLVPPPIMPGPYTVLPEGVVIFPPNVSIFPIAQIQAFAEPVDFQIVGPTTAALVPAPALTLQPASSPKGRKRLVRTAPV